MHLTTCVYGIQPEKVYFHFKSLHESKAHTSEPGQHVLETSVPELDEEKFEEVCLAIENLVFFVFHSVVSCYQYHIVLYSVSYHCLLSYKILKC